MKRYNMQMILWWKCPMKRRVILSLDSLLFGDDYEIQENAPDSLGGYEITWIPYDEDEVEEEQIWVYDDLEYQRNGRT